MKLKLIDGQFSICKTPDFSGVCFEDGFFFLSRTDEEYSVVCRTENEPQNALKADRGWCAIRIEGMLDLSMTGVLSQISAALAGSGIAVFVISTFNTDYVLVKDVCIIRAVKALQENGHTFAGGPAF